MAGNESSAATSYRWPRFLRWLELLIYPWHDPAVQAEYDYDPDDLIRSGYGW